MTYSEMLKQAKENKVEAGQLMTAQELDDRLNEVGVTLDEQNFNKACAIIYDCWVHRSHAKSVYWVVRSYEKRSNKYKNILLDLTDIHMMAVEAEELEENNNNEQD